MTDLLLVVVGITILVSGGELLVKGAASFARGMGISPLAVGLTVVAFGTSAPELAVSVGASLTGSGTLAFGNIFGSNMANIGLIVGLAAILHPLPIEDIVVRRELPMMLLSLAACFVMAFDTDLGEARDAFVRSDGLVLLLLFIVFLYYTVGDLIQQRQSSGIIELSEGLEGGASRGGNPPSLDLGLVVLGLGGLIFGADLTVDAGVSLARELGIPEVIVGLTMVSVGTSLPELVSAIAAIRRREIQIAVGGVVGSNIFNTLLVCGVTSTIHPMQIPERGQLDLVANALLSLALLFVARSHDRRIIRYEGLGLLTLYLAYVTFRTLYLPG